MGKTTLLKLISNQLEANEGEIRYQGQNVVENAGVQEKIFCATAFSYKDNFLLNGKLSRVIDVMSCLYPTFDKAYAKHLFEAFGLDLMDKYPKLSAGNKTLVVNILGLASYCPVTLFDEPTNGLDSINREKFFQEVMANYSTSPRLLVISTHLISEVQNYLTDVIMLKDKQILLNEPLEVIQQKSYRLIGGAPLLGERVVRTEQLGNQLTQVVFDELSEGEKSSIEAAGVTIESVDLQILFNSLMEE